MKAAKQIIDYLRRRGVLSKEQLVELAAEGLLRWEEVYEDADTPDAVTDEPPVLPDEEDETACRWRPERKRGPVVYKGPVLEVGDLRRRLNDRFDGWENQLQALVQIGRRLNSS